MIGQYLSNNNKTATVAFRQNFYQLNSPCVTPMVDRSCVSAARMMICLLALLMLRQSLAGWALLGRQAGARWARAVRLPVCRGAPRGVSRVSSVVTAPHERDRIGSDRADLAEVAYPLLILF
jgi:hypothetical protein